ncbi:hypothetical protein HOG48_05515 [Candidatus Peregrinibacteria bacterium]|nr:hypothetical protein [Candidatus Peregrinibacteria bacterium]
MPTGNGQFGVVPTPKDLPEGVLPLTGSDGEIFMAAMELHDVTRGAHADVAGLYEDLDAIDVADEETGVDTLERGDGVVA